MLLCGAQEEGPEGQIDQESRRRSRSTPPISTANIKTSRRPVARGRSPATSPTQAQANIWYRHPWADATRDEGGRQTRVVHISSVKPKPAPKTGRREQGLRKLFHAAVPASSGRSAAPKADSTPSMAIAFGIHAPSRSEPAPPP